MSWSSKWSSLWVLILVLLKCGASGAMMAIQDPVYPRLIVAASHTALSGDLAVMILAMSTTDRSTTVPTSTEDADIVMEGDGEGDASEKFGAASPDPLVIRVLRLDGFMSELVGEVPVKCTPSAGGNVSLMIPCGFFSRGGTYSLQLQQKSAPHHPKLTDIADLHDLQMRTTLDVRWPTPSLSLEPQHFKTYPDQPVLATLEYTGISCSASPGVPITSYTLQLIYCGASVLSCDPRNKSHIQMLYSEEVKGFPAQRVVTLRCEFFGMAGHYALRLKPSDANPSAPTSSAYIKVEWSNQFVFNVHARSVYPCDDGTGGVSVLFEYPSCRLQGDRVRVYGRLRADVASLAPPSTLHYVAELKAPPGKHTLTFSCDIFTERFVEYCFVYVSKAITGAMSEVRVDCIPTFPLQEGGAGGWGPWSQWTPCSTSCVGGTRNRYRFCDTPPPRYGAKFCQGKAVETESCGGASQLDLHGAWNPGDWECRHGKGLAAERPEVNAEVGTRCRCGCVVNLGEDNPRKILAASTQACPGRSFWLLQAEPQYAVRLHLDQARFPCPGQYVRVRDGDSLSAELLADVAFDKNAPETGTVISSERSLLLEFFSDEMEAVGESCVGGFLAHITMYPKPLLENDTAIPLVTLNTRVVSAAGRWALWLTPAHLVAASLLILMFLVSVFLALQYALKYRKYQIAEDLDSLTDNSACSGSMQGLARRARAMSSTTLISEVVSLVRLPRRGSSKHARLEETPGDVEDGYESTETQVECEEEHSLEAGTLKPKEPDENSLKTITPSVMSTPSRRSSSSTSTLAPGQPEVKYARPVKLRTVGPISPVSEEASISEGSRPYSGTSASTSLNNGFSPASTSSNVSSLRCGKDSKERRNRERLLQGPGSEFSLANPDMDLELDYYDYNVVNAGAAPGSYLGMDPAFLVWIPPLAPGEAEILESIEEDHHYEEIPDRRTELGSKVALDTEGAALTPSEYKRARSRMDEERIGQEGGQRGSRINEIRPKRLDPGESRLHDEIISEYRARLSEGMLPIHRILEDSRVRVSEESLSRHAQDDVVPLQSDVIPNRLLDDIEKPDSVQKGETKFTPRATRNRIIAEQERSRTPSLTRSRVQDDHARPRIESPNNSRIVDGLDSELKGSAGASKARFPEGRIEQVERTTSPAHIRSLLQENLERNSRNSQANPSSLRIGDDAQRNRGDEVEGGKVSQVQHRRKSIFEGSKLQKGDAPGRDPSQDGEPKEEPATISKPKPLNLLRRQEDAADLNATSGSKIGGTVNIPLKEFSRNRLDSPVRVHKSKEYKKDVAEKEVLSPDYGVEVDIKDEARDSFYDLIGEGRDGLKFADEDDDYIDNKITV